MLQTDVPKSVQTALLGGKRITVAMATGLILGIGIMLFLRENLFPGRAPAPLNESILTFVGIAFLTATMVARFVVSSNLIVAAGRKFGPSDDSAAILDGLRTAYLNHTILSVALLEGTGLFLAVCYLIDGHPWTLLLAAVLAACILIQLPTLSRFAQFSQRVMQARDTPPSHG